MSVQVPTAELVARLIGARDAHIAIEPPSVTGRLSIDEAYRTQDALRAALTDRGELVVGWKAGFTSAGAQAAYECSEPVSAFLLASGMFGTGVSVPVARFVELGVEAEIAFLMREDLRGPGVTPIRALAAVAGALPALELVDVRFRGKAVASDVIADGVYASAVVLGAPLTDVTHLDLALEGVVYELNGVTAATNAGAEVMGSPLNALAFIANQLGARGLQLHAGDVVMSGSVSKILRPQRGDVVRATFTRLGSVSVRFV